MAIVTIAPGFAKKVEIIELKSVVDPNQQQAAPSVISKKMQAARQTAERLVEDALIKLQQINSHDELAKSLRDSYAVFIFPGVLKVAFYLGGREGKGVLFARSSKGEWSYPTFYTLKQASAGLQFGFTKSLIVMTVMTQKGLRSIINNNFQMGASAAGTIFSERKGKGVATTTNLRQDVKIYSLNQGLFLGFSLNGTEVSENALLNHAYYGQRDASTQTIIFKRQYTNKQADGLRKYLSRFNYLYN